ncbi:MAG: YbaN family protein [Methanobacteriaceae archaeon]|jgi:uncharacterized membrane protein YbaN (DUF454 family)
MEIKRVFFFSLGVILLSTGAAGVFIPLLLTTPFVLASFFCFGKSSKRAESWISNNCYFGSYIENYKTKKGVSLDVKLKSIAFLWLMLIFSSTFFFNQFYILLLLIIVGMAVTAHILLLKTKI